MNAIRRKCWNGISSLRAADDDSGMWVGQNTTKIKSAAKSIILYNINKFQNTYIRRGGGNTINTYFTVSRIFPPITVAACSKAWNAFVRSNTGTVGSNPTIDVDVCPRFLCVCVVLGR
jgi:hypothetical protein